MRRQCQLEATSQSIAVHRSDHWLRTVLHSAQEAFVVCRRPCHFAPDFVTCASISHESQKYNSPSEEFLPVFLCLVSLNSLMSAPTGNVLPLPQITTDRTCGSSIARFMHDSTPARTLDLKWTKNSRQVLFKCSQFVATDISQIRWSKKWDIPRKVQTSCFSSESVTWLKLVYLEHFLSTFKRTHPIAFTGGLFTVSRATLPCRAKSTIFVGPLPAKGEAKIQTCTSKLSTKGLQ